MAEGERGKSSGKQPRVGATNVPLNLNKTAQPLSLMSACWVYHKTHHASLLARGKEVVIFLSSDHLARIHKS
jgi:hypothetical protein